jgi:hypothetical protein
MPHTTDEDDGEISNQDKDSIHQHLLSGAEYVLVSFYEVFSAICAFAEFCSAGPLAPYLAKARWICQSIHPYLDLSRVFYAGVPDAAQEEELADADE